MTTTADGYYLPEPVAATARDISTHIVASDMGTMISVERHDKVVVTFEHVLLCNSHTLTVNIKCDERDLASDVNIAYETGNDGRVWRTRSFDIRPAARMTLEYAEQIASAITLAVAYARRIEADLKIPAI
jgi:hypothetical protein